MGTRLFEGLLWFSLAVLVGHKSIGIELGTPTSPGPGFMPFILALFLALLALIIFFTRSPASDLKGEMTSTLGVRLGLRALAIVSLIIGYVLFFKVLGYLISSFILMIFLFRFAGNRRWISVLSSSLLAAFLSYLLFSVILKLDLPKGVLLYLLK